MEHCRFHRLVILKTGVEQMSNTVKFNPKMFKLPTINISNATINGVETLIRTLQVLHQDVPLRKIEDKQQSALANLAKKPR